MIRSSIQLYLLFFLHCCLPRAQVKQIANKHISARLRATWCGCSTCQDFQELTPCYLFQILFCSYKHDGVCCFPKSFPILTMMLSFSLLNTHTFLIFYNWAQIMWSIHHPSPSELAVTVTIEILVYWIQYFDINLQFVLQPALLINTV